MRTFIGFFIFTVLLLTGTTLYASCSTYDCHIPDKNGKTGAHNFQRKDSSKSPCAPCHKPHNAGSKIPLWNNTNLYDDGPAYSVYTSPTGTLDNIPTSNVYAGTEACMSCHDGMSESTGMDTAFFNGGIATNFKMGTFYVNYSKAQHPIGMTYDSTKDTGLNSNVVNGKVIGSNGNFKLANGNVECITCHDPHKKGPAGFMYNHKVNEIDNKKLLRTTDIKTFCNECHQDK